MKNTRQTKREASEEIHEGLELLFGSEEDLTDEELRAELEQVGVDGDALSRKAHEYLRGLATHQFSSLGRDVPQEMNVALRQLKPPTPEQERDRVKSGADARVKRIIDAARDKTSLVLSSIAASASVQPDYAFRNKGDLSESDLEILRAGEEELKADPPSSVKEERDE